MRDFADDYSNVVDVYNSATGAWTTAQLSVRRNYLAATSVGYVAVFAGGWLQPTSDVPIEWNVLPLSHARFDRCCFQCRGLVH
jgi:hypothetical protein